MKTKLLLLFCLMIGILHTHAEEATDDAKVTTKSLQETTATTATLSSLAGTQAAQPDTNEAGKDKRQIGTKDTPVYPNHRSDDPEDPQETIYGPKPNHQFIIRPVAPHQHQQHEDHQQLRNYPATIRSHNTQLLEQSQEIQHFAYLQDISRNHPKTALQGKSPQSKKVTATARAQAQAQQQMQYSNAAEEAEQRYAVAIQAQGPLPHQARHYQPANPYHLAAQQQQQQQAQQQAQHQQAQQHQHQQQQQYQIIPEEQFLKLLEEELQARAYHEEQIRRQQGATAPQQQASAAGAGLGSYRHRVPQEPAPAPAPAPEFVQYVPRHRGGPKYLPHSHAHQQQPQPQINEPQVAEPEQPDIPPQIAYYQPQITYKTHPNHPLAKSSLENEIEKLLAANKPSAVQIIDNSNEPSAVVHQHHQPPPPQPRPQRPHIQPKAYIGSTTPNSLLDANNQPFIPSLFRFSNYQNPTPIYPTQVPQHVVEAQKLGPVVYPTQVPPAQPAQPSQYYYQEAAPSPSPKPKAYRAKQFGNKLPREKELKHPAPTKYAPQQLVYEYERQPQAPTHDTRPHGTSIKFYPSPPDPNQAPPTTQPQPLHPQPPTDFRQYVLPSPSPSQSSIFVSQGTGIATPSRPTTLKPKTLEDVKQLHLPQPGGKPLTQAEFQALLDAGYPVTAVPVPVPVPYDQYIKEHPDYRTQLMRFAQQYLPQQHPHQHQHGHPQQRSLAVASEPSVKIVSSPEPQQADSVTYLQPIDANQKRRPRDEKETEVAGKQTDEAEN